MTSLILLTLALQSPGLSAVPTKPTSASQVQKREMDRQMKKDLQLVLQKKDIMEGRRPTALPSAEEKQLYAELVAAFDRNDELTFSSRFQGLMARYPRGLFGDEALYLAGMMALTNKQYAKAVKHFGDLPRRYPRSSRVRAAQFAKASAYKKMNLPEFARTVFKEVKTKYPGSPEARRAELELKLVK